MNHNHRENAGPQKHPDLPERQHVHQRDFRNRRYSLIDS